MPPSVTYSSANDTSPASTGILGGLLKTFNVSRTNLIVIGTFIILGALIILIIVIVLVKRCLNSDDGKGKRKYKDNKSKDIFGNDDEKYESKYGYIDINITYNRRRKRLTISDMMANNLVSTSPDPPDCFIKIFMLNLKQKPINVKTTKIKVDNYTPFFSESFSFHIENIKDAVIYFQVIDDNPNGNDIILGDGRLEMKKLDMNSFIGVICTTYVILEKPNTKLGFGDVCIILSWRQNKQRIVVLEAKDLVFKYSKSKHAGSFTYPWVYAKICLYVNKVRKKKFTTKKLFNTQFPYFMETFDAPLKANDFHQTCIKIAFYETLPPRIPRKIGNVYIGNPTINHKINAIGKFHWDLACDSLESPKAMWHSLVYD